MNIWFTADTHFGHKGIIEYDKRPFDSVEEMDCALIKNWNDVVEKKDIVYLLGDFCWRGPKYAIEVLEQLNGQIHLVMGNHDRLNVKLKSMFVTTSWQKIIKRNSYKLLLSHYAFRTWGGQGKGTYNIHGHCHGLLVPLPNALDVGCMIWNYKPISIDQVVEKMEKIKNVFT